MRLRQHESITNFSIYINLKKSNSRKKKMEFPKYDGNIHPDEWIKDIQKYKHIWHNNYGGFLNTAISLLDPTINLPTEINDIENLRNALKEDISFKVFKITNKRKLQSLKYIPKKDGKNSKFILKFRKLC